jgi:type I restriction enzyme M protein
LIRSGADTGKPADQRSLREVWDDWEQDGRAFWQQMDALVKTLDGLIADQPDSTTKHQ